MGELAQRLAGLVPWTRHAGAHAEGWRARVARLRSERGTATIEFALVFPIILFLSLILLQVTLLMVGNLFVHYAAAAATRTAIVQIPVDNSHLLEPRNYIVADEQFPKYDAIRQTAVFALMPVSGRSEAGDIDADGFVEGLRSYYEAHGQDGPRWLDTFAADRLRYADEYTEVTLFSTEIDDNTVDFIEVTGGHEFGPKDAVTVQVVHKFFLSVPYVRYIFADGPMSNPQGGGGAYAEITTQYTLTNEGINPELPPYPRLPRQP